MYIYHNHLVLLYKSTIITTVIQFLFLISHIIYTTNRPHRNEIRKGSEMHAWKIENHLIIKKIELEFTSVSSCHYEHLPCHVNLRDDIVVFRYSTIPSRNKIVNDDKVFDTAIPKLHFYFLWCCLWRILFFVELIPMLKRIG